MPVHQCPTDLSLDIALWRQKKPLDLFPVFDGTTTSATTAKRNATGTARPSLLLTKALLAALLGKVVNIRSDAQCVSVLSESLSANGTLACALDWATNQWHSKFGSTYHCGLLALGEAIVHAPLAADFCNAWADLLDLNVIPRLPITTADLQTLAQNALFKDVLIRVADELYYWTRYRDAKPDGANDRLASATVVRDATPGPVNGADLAPILLDPIAIRARVENANAPTTAPTAVPPSQPGAFKGWQKGVVITSITRGEPALLFGPTASGKTTCFNEAIAELGLPFEAIAGKEGLLDLDFFGSLTKTTKGLAWVDGPLARAMRRAAKEKVVVWLDEFTRIPTQQVNILIDLLNVVPENLMLQSGAQLWGKSQTGFYRRVEVPQCNEVFNCPAENLVIVAGCNLGRAYAVHAIDPALLRRFPRKVEFRYLAPDDEAQLLVEKTGAGARLAKACVAVATKLRQMAETAEVAAPLDPASLIVWTQAIAERAQFEKIKLANKTRLIEIAQAEARTTWLLGVLAVDLNGLLPDGKVAGLLDTIRDLFIANL